MKALTKPLACAVALLATAFAGNSYAAGYNYSVTLGITTPKASAAELAGKNKTLPAGIDFSPCIPAAAEDVANKVKAAPNLDQLAFTIKYDAGKETADLQNVYVIFSHPDTATAVAPAYPYLVLKRNKLGADVEFMPYPDVAKMNAGHTIAATPSTLAVNVPKAADAAYTSKAYNLGYAQTETILGGNLVLEGLPAGLWLVTAIIGDSATIDFDKPSTWSAWDSKPFMLRKPWKGTAEAVCE